jgi:hypothetical protein
VRESCEGWKRGWWVLVEGGDGVVKDKEVGTMLHLRTINQTTEPRSQTNLIWQSQS